MKLFYGWVIVAVGIVVGCIGMGGVMSFGVFLQPMADLGGLSRVWGDTCGGDMTGPVVAGKKLVPG